MRPLSAMPASSIRRRARHYRRRMPWRLRALPGLAGGLALVLGSALSSGTAYATPQVPSPGAANAAPQAPAAAAAAPAEPVAAASRAQPAAAASPAQPGSAATPAQPTPATSPEDIAALRQQIDALRREYEQRLTALEQRLDQLAGGSAAAAAPATPALPGAAAAPPGAAAGAPSAAAQAAAAPPVVPSEAPAVPAPAAGPGGEAPIGGAPSQTSNYFNPSVSVIGNYLAVGGSNHVAQLPNSELREAELSLQAIVDPYARADVFLSFGEQGVSVEEGFVTFTSLPQDLLAKVGRMRVAFGTINTLHLHVLPWADEPLIVVNLLGGEDGWIGTGVSLARLLALPGDTFSELTAQVFRGESPNLFSAPTRSDLAYNGHYRIFRDLSEATNVTLGLSYAYGPNGTTPDAKTRLEGLDFTLRYKPLVTANYHSLVVRGEVMRSRRDQPGGPQRALGWFASADYQFSKRWFAGARLEAADRATDARHTDTGRALLLTFWPSEFSQLRAELRRRHYGLEEQAATEFLLQLQFAIGAHGAHPF
jgi:hypothetical protein